MIRSLKTKFPANMTLLFLAAFFSLTMSFSAFAERPYKTCSPKEVHPIWWEATMNRNIALTVSETNKTVRLDAGDEVTVTNFSRTGTNIIMLEDGTHCRVNRSEFTVTGDACTPGDYSDENKLCQFQKAGQPDKVHDLGVDRHAESECFYRLKQKLDDDQVLQVFHRNVRI